MSGLLCCLRARRQDMGAALSHQQEGDAGDGSGGAAVAPPTMADVIRERKKKAGGAVGTLRRRIANAARRPRDSRPDRGCEHARYIRSVVSRWRLADVFVLCEELEALAALRDLTTRAELAREPAPALPAALPQVLLHSWWCDVQVCGAGWSIGAHRAVLAARSTYFRDLLQRQPPGCARVVLGGAAAGVPRAAARAALLAMYGARDACLCNKYENNAGGEGDLDILNEDSNSCGCGRWSRCEVRRLCAALGCSGDPLHTSMRYLLESRELCDVRLVFRLPEPHEQYGFRAALELPAHRALLAARSRVLRSVLARAGAGGCVCVDEAVLPRRFARALLHAAYTDQVDLSLIGRNSSSPSNTNGGSSGTSAWGVGRGSSRVPTTTMLDDAFQLYEIARFLEMPIVVQGCEDAIVEALSPETLPHVLKWSSAPHASQWVHRQASRYLRDEFTTLSSHPSLPSVPAPALSAALSSPFLQCAEGGVLRAAVRWAGDQPPAPGLVWGGGNAARRGARRAPPPAARELLAPLLPLVRTEHLPHDHDLMNQLIRRGILPAPTHTEDTADKWLGRGSFRPIRCFLPYLDEIKALLEDQAPPDEELARARRDRYVHRIPDLYIGAVGTSVGASGNVSGAGSEAPHAAPNASVLGGRALAVLCARVRELRHSPSAVLAAKHAHYADEVHRQLALRAVRERSLPDSCADLLLQEQLNDPEEEYESGRSERDEGEHCARDECCEHRTLSGSGSLRCASTGSLRSAPPLHIPIDNNSRPGTCRREPSSGNDNSHHSWSSECGRLSAAVPDVAMAPNANTHLLTPRDYFRHPPPWEYGGVVLQLDLGDGATHTPRPGSRAQRNSGASTARPRDYAQAMSCLRSLAEDEESRAGLALGARDSRRARRNTLPHSHGGGHSSRLQEPPAPTHAPRGAACPSPSPRHLRHYPLHPHDYRLEPYSGSASTSRGHSPNNYA